MWTIRYTSPKNGRRREMGVGPVRDVPLSRAREHAAEARRLIREGIDPIDQRRLAKAAQISRVEHAFRTVAEQYIKEQSPGWRDSRLPGIWTSSLTRLAFPIIGAKPIELIGTDDVLAVLRPIWPTINETADRLRGRIERILDYASTHGWRTGENPARWRGHLANILPKPYSVAVEKHRPAVSWTGIAAVMDVLTRASGVAALAVRFACLTAARSGEVRGATWAEVDLQTKVWVIPAERMKAAREHRVPLCAAAMDALTAARTLSNGEGLVFPGGRLNRPLSDVALSKALHQAAGTKAVTVHGLRSTFRDWTAEHTDFPREVAEMALAHAIGDRVEAAYRRGDLFAKRRELMDAWGGGALPCPARRAGLPSRGQLEQ